MRKRKLDISQESVPRPPGRPKGDARPAPKSSLARMLGVLDLFSEDEPVRTVDAAAAKLAAAKGRPLRVGDFRDLLGLTRKTLIPLLEHFDARKLTRRNGDFREVV